MVTEADVADVVVDELNDSVPLEMECELLA